MFSNVSNSENLGLNSEHMQTQAQHIWSMLDDMAAQDPAAYRKFIDRHLSEGKEAVAPPQPHMCVRTNIYSPQTILFINFCGWPRVPAPKTDQDPIPVIGSPLQQMNETECGSYSLAAVAFNPRVLEETGRDAKNPQERDALVNLAMDYLQEQHKIEISRNYQILPRDTTLKGSLENLHQGFRSKSQDDGKKFEQDLTEIEKTFGPLPSGAKDSLLHQLSNLTVGETRSNHPMTSPTSTNQSKIMLGTNQQKPDQTKRKGLIEEIGNNKEVKIACPKHTLKREISNGQEHLVATIHLPGISSVKECELDISEDDLSLQVADKFDLHLKLPVRICEDEAKAKFNKTLSDLIVTMPVYI